VALPASWDSQDCSLPRTSKTMSEPLVVALLGAESTGKTTLARQLADALATPARRVAVVAEYLREFCDLRGRTPLEHEQRHIAEEQSRRIETAARSHDIVVADTTALMIAVYSHHVFGDDTLYGEAMAAHARSELTLLTALDLPWKADPQRDGPHVRVPVDTRIRAALAAAGTSYAVVSGTGEQRLRMALACVNRALAPAETRSGASGVQASTDGTGGSSTRAGSARWKWVCERCGDADCERHWLAQERSAQAGSTAGR